MNINLKLKTFCVFGLRGSGKSTLMHYVATQYKAKAFLYDTLDECPVTTKYHSYTPRVRSSQVELEYIVRQVMNSHQYDLLLIDEANRFCPSKPKPLPQAIADLNDWCRHPPYKMGAGFIARRPVQLNQDLTELADYIFIFRLGGKNDGQYLNDLVSGLGDAVAKIPQYHFILVQPDRSYQLMPPITPVAKSTF